MSIDADQVMHAGLEAIRADNSVPGPFSATLIDAAVEAANRPLGADHEDRTGQRFVTLDPASSVDLDQAFDIVRDGDDLVLHYAIADVGWFVRPGDPLDQEAFRRGVTIYMPDQRATLYPTELSEGAASLLPDVDRPAIVFEVRVAPDGSVALDAATRCIIRNRAKLAYATVTAADVPAGFDELYRRIVDAEVRRGAYRVEFPEQQVERTSDGYRLIFRPRVESEEQNAAMSLATNMAVADVLMKAQIGLFRVMPEVTDRQIGRLRNAARAFGLSWPAEMTLADFERSLPRSDPRTSAFLIAVRRAAGGASYSPHADGEVPWHAALQATYAHATAPLRRLQDRYINEAVLAVMAGRSVAPTVLAAFERLPQVMLRADQIANRVDRQVIELAEAVLLSDRVGDAFDAVVIDEGEGSAEVQIAEPAVTANVAAHRVDPGDDVRVRLVTVDVATRLTVFERIG